MEWEYNYIYLRLRFSVISTHFYTQMCFVLVAHWSPEKKNITMEGLTHTDGILEEKKNMKEENIESKVDALCSPGAIVPRPKKFKRTKTLSKTLSIPGVLIISSMLILGALLGFLWTTYTIKTEGDININGGQGEAVALYYDDTLLVGTSMNLTIMDFPVLNAGDNKTKTHEFRNENGHGYNISIDLSGCPLEYVNESDPWYGVDIYAEPTELYVAPETNETFTLHYIVSPLFADPLVDFPFLMVINIECYDTTPIGNPDSYTFDSGSILEVPAPGVLGNDVLPGEGNMTAALLTNATYGDLTFNEDGSFTYETFDPEYEGDDSFTYRPMIGEVEGYPATVSIHVVHNYPPITTNDTILVGYLSTQHIDVTLNDVDLENDTLTVVTYQTPPAGITITKTGNDLAVYNYYGAAGTYNFVIWVDVSDGTHTVREYLTITCVL